MKIIIIVCVSILLYGCTNQHNSATASVVEIDSALVNSQFRTIIHQYISTYPQYKNILIYTDIPDGWEYNTQNTYISIEPMLYYDFSQHGSRNRGCPAFYTIVENRKIFIASRMDNLFYDNAVRPFVKTNSLPRNFVYLRGERGWYIEIENNKKYKILTKKCAGFVFNDTIKVEQMEIKF